MADVTKYQPINGGTLMSDVNSLFSIIKSRRTVAFAYGFMFAFVVFTAFLAFNSSTTTYSPGFSNIFSGSDSVSTNSSNASPGSQHSSFFSYFFRNSSLEQNDRVHLSPLPDANASRSSNTTVRSPIMERATPRLENRTENTENEEALKANQTTQTVPVSPFSGNQTLGLPVSPPTVPQPTSIVKNDSQSVKISPNPEVVRNDTQSTVSRSPEVMISNHTKPLPAKSPVVENQNKSSGPKSIASGKNSSRAEENRIPEQGVSTNYTASLSKKQNGGTHPVSGGSVNQKDYLESLKNCDFFDGEWVPDDSYPLYRPGSCSLIDEQFNCNMNGRPDKNYQKLKWKPKGCNLPRLDGSRMLNLLKGKRLVFVGDSLNRNMWESLVCILRNSVKDQSKVYEAHGRHLFRGEAAYSFIFKDYDCTVEFFVSPFLVREWEVVDKGGKKKETLRLDLVGRSSDQYKGADIIVFNTGHWWTHDKTARGKDYYQEGSHVYEELNVLEAFRKAITTWARWVDKNINPMKSMVFFRGYSASHFSGGQWNSGGQCDSETQPIKNETFLRPYQPKMIVLENVLRGMKTHVTYLNVTKMTDFRKDGHPSIYRKQNLSEEEMRSPLRFQDCSHWCLPGVPDAWNEILFAELLLKQQQQKRS